MASKNYITIKNSLARFSIYILVLAYVACVHCVHDTIHFMLNHSSLQRWDDAFLHHPSILVFGDIEKTWFNYCLPKYCNYCKQNTAWHITLAQRSQPPNLTVVPQKNSPLWLKCVIVYPATICTTWDANTHHLRSRQPTNHSSTSSACQVAAWFI